MLDFIWTFNRSVFVFFTVFYSFQILYTIISLIFSLKKPEPSDKLHRYLFTSSGKWAAPADAAASAAAPRMMGVAFILSLSPRGCRPGGL